MFVIFLKKCIVLDIGKVIKYLVIFKHFRVSLVAYAINPHLEHSFHIDINKNIISYFNTMKMLFIIFLPNSCKKMKHLSFLMHFGKQIDDKRWLWVGLVGRCDRYTVVGRGVNVSWLGHSLYNRRVIVWYKLKSSQCYFEMLKAITLT